MPNSHEDILCTGCRQSVSWENATRSGSGEPYCWRCFHRTFVICASCGHFTRTEDTTIIPRTEERLQRILCPICAAHTVCGRCGEVFRRADTTWSDYSCAYVCDHCAEEDADALEEEREAEEEEIRVIHPYHPDVPLVFRDTPDSPIEHKLYMGVELEIDGGGEDHENAREILACFGNDAHAEHDGSLCEGFEIVTQPFTLEYFQRELSEKFRDGMKVAKSLGYKNITDTCGLHVHVGRDGMGQTVAEQDAAIAKLWLLMHKFWPELVVFSRRESAQLHRWAQAPRLCDFQIESVEEETIHTLASKIKEFGNTDRYRALNQCNNATVEFRLFRGTLNHETLAATVQLVHSLVCLAMVLTLDMVRGCTWKFITDIARRDNKELSKYLTRKGL